MAKGSIRLTQQFFLLVLIKPSIWEFGRLAIILWSFKIFLIFPNFLRSKVWSWLPTWEATRIYKFFTNNHILFHVWWKKNLLNHYLKILWKLLLLIALPLETFSWPFLSMKMYALRHNFYMKNVRLITLCITNTCVYLFAKPNFFFAGGESYFTPIFFANLLFSPNWNPVWKVKEFPR